MPDTVSFIASVSDISGVREKGPRDHDFVEALFRADRAAFRAWPRHRRAVRSHPRRRCR
jgi:hypothetical protein